MEFVTGSKVWLGIKSIQVKFILVRNISDIRESMRYILVNIIRTKMVGSKRF